MNISSLISSSKIDDNDINNPTKEEDIFDNKEANNQSLTKYENEKFNQALTRNAEDIKRLKIKNDNLQKLAEHRIKYSVNILDFVVSFFAFVLIIIFLKGFKYIELDNDVLITILVTNAVDVIGILFIVAKWLYPQDIKQSRKNKKQRGN